MSGVKYYVRAHKKTGPHKIHELSAHRTEEEAQQAAEDARKSGKWDNVAVTPAPLQTSGPKPRPNSGRRSTSRRG